MPSSHPDLHHALDALQRGRTSAAGQLERSIEAAQSPACEHAFLKTAFDGARRAAQDKAAASRPLMGLAVSVKDLFDVQGEVSAAGSVVLADSPPAAADCPAVARLRAAGAAFIGRTNMTEFAYSGVGINPHYGTPANP
ncbi:MAG TPA: amidase family protein, partial [Ramlibacter sp.]